MKPASNSDPNLTQLKLKLPKTPYTHTLITYSDTNSPFISFSLVSTTHPLSLTHTSHHWPSSSRLTISFTDLKLCHTSATLSRPPFVFFFFFFLVHFVSHCFFFICVCVFYFEKENHKSEIFVFVLGFLCLF